MQNSHKRLLELLDAKSTPSSKQISEIPKLLREGFFNMPDAEFEYCYLSLKKNPNDEQSLLLINQLVSSGIELKIDSSVLRRYLKKLMDTLGKIPYIARLNMLLNYSFDKEPKSQYFQSLLEEDVTDYEAKKRMISVSRRQGRHQQYTKLLNQYLQENPNDSQGWIELGFIFLERGLQLRALFCFQQLLLLAPQNDHYYLKVAEVYCSLGGNQNLETAIKYYSYVVGKNPSYARALWGLYKALQNLGSKIPEPMIELKNETQDLIHNLYSRKNPSIKIHCAF